MMGFFSIIIPRRETWTCKAVCPLQAVSKMRKFLIILLLCPLYLQAQDSLRTKVYLYPPVVNLKFSPLSLIDPLSSIQFALEYQIAEKTSLQHELGYITPLLYREDLGYKQSSGLRFRSEFRVFLGRQGPVLTGFYLAPELLFIHFRYERNAIYGQDCSDPYTCAYYQYKDYTVQKQVYGVHQKIGFQSISSRFLIDLYTGIGYRHVRVRNIDAPPQYEYYDDFSFSSRKTEGNYGLPSLSFGFKLGYLLSKKRELDWPSVSR